ncbi:ACP S-malonyltransferase [Nakamurella flavida]|uniref:[acyl-carrier-protein] S-malonyltransferase n=1 Tax=Nakamurella flavida TaxID=363630 RepID=A0A939BYP2_9ACTN|nr:ACP S-malonyltransferase [Nakamurella flavida]MBM9474898.1 ACP S-malonyltransferase [Nakamurella flavida]
MLAVVCPGQGSQKPGMFAPWLALPGAPEQLATLSERAGLDLIALGTGAGAEEIKDTAVTQPLVVAAALLAAAHLELPAGATVAGHSVGELAAAALAGVISTGDAVGLAGTRGRAMSAACALEPTGMSAVLGGDPETVLAALAERDLVGANVNGAGQIVAAGTTAALRALADDPITGTRVIPLPVAGAFHTSYMATAQLALAPDLAALDPADPVRPLLGNADGAVVGSGAAFLQSLGAQVTRPVRWDLCMQTLRAEGVTGVLELPPAGTLVGLVKRELKGVATMALKGPDDLDAAAAFMAEHAGPGTVAA